MNINVIMIRNGCMWVCMGTIGYTNTNVQANKTKKDRNGVAGYDSRPCMTGKFLCKRCICERRYQG